MSDISKLETKRRGRPLGSNKRVATRSRAMRFLEQTLKNDDADDLARVAAASKLIDLTAK